MTIDKKAVLEQIEQDKDRFKELVNGGVNDTVELEERVEKSIAGQVKDRAEEFATEAVNRAIANSGYDFLADYDTGIELTEYNQVLRDTNGEFWRVSGSTELPYTTTGAGLPEGGVFVTVGDAALRQELDGDVTMGKGAIVIRGGVVHFADIDDMLGAVAAPIKEGQAAIVDGRTYTYSTTPENPTYWLPSGGGWTIQDSNELGLRYADADTLPLSGVSVIMGVVGGKLIAGAPGGELYESTDGADWDLIGSFGFITTSNQARIYELGDGEVLVNTQTELRKSSGWPSDPSSATFNVVQEAFTYPTGQSRFHQGWGVRVAGQYVFAVEYGNPKPQAFRAYLSTDNGSTFTQVFNLDDHFVTDSESNAHNHGCCIDPWHDTTPRLWVMTADSGFIAWFWSDDLGQNWNRLPDENFPRSATSNEPPNYVVVDATRYGLVIGSDEPPNGTAVMPRDADYSSDPKIYTAFEFADDSLNQTTHVAQDQAVVGDIVYTLLRRSGERPDLPNRIVATSALTRQGVLIWEDDGNLGNNSLRALDFFNGQLIARNESESNAFIFRLYSDNPVRESGIELFDTGHVLGGDSLADKRAIAVGRGAESRGLESTAVGQGSLASGISSVAVGNNAESTAARSLAIGGTNVGTNKTEATGQGSIAAGANAKATSDFTVAAGNNAHASSDHAVAVGSGANASGNSSVSIGRGSSASDTESVSVGRNAASGGNRSAAYGTGASSGGIRSLAAGNGASASALESVALGNGAAATHANSVALGNGSESTGANDISGGARYLTLGNREAGTPPAGTGRLYFINNNGVQELRVRFANGNIVTIATDTD